MIEPARLQRFVEETLPQMARSGRRPSDAGYALPDASLDLLASCVTSVGIARVFEFGSGRSTKRFLELGCRVALVEDGKEWLEQTRQSLTDEEQARLAAFALPLETVWLSGMPLRSWRLPNEAMAELRAAEFILIDSPAYPPFREHALAVALAETCGALIAIDDAAIPTVGRFCERFAKRNAAAHVYAGIDHGLSFFVSRGEKCSGKGRPLVETLKGWRRYRMAPRSA